MNEHRLTKPGPQNAALRDYNSVRRAIAFISEHWRTQPTIEAMAEAAAVTPDELHHLFRRWAGLTPKAFMQALTLDHAKGLLRDSASVLDAALELRAVRAGTAARSVRHPRGDVAGRMEERRRRHDAGLRLSSLAVRHRHRDRLRPRARRPRLRRSRRGAGRARRHAAALAARELFEDRAGTAALAQRIFDTKLWRPDQPLRVVLIGTDFEVRVWETLLKIPMGRAVCYSDIASQDQEPQGFARGRRGGRQEPDLLRGALPSRARQERRADRLSLGPHPQAGDDRLGSRTGGVAVGQSSIVIPGRRSEPGISRFRVWSFVLAASASPEIGPTSRRIRADPGRARPSGRRPGAGAPSHRAADRNRTGPPPPRRRGRRLRGALAAREERAASAARTTPEPQGCTRKRTRGRTPIGGRRPWPARLPPLRRALARTGFARTEAVTSRCRRTDRECRRPRRSGRSGTCRSRGDFRTRRRPLRS